MFDKCGFLIGYLKLIVYKVAYGKRFQFSWDIRFMPSSKIRIAKGGELKLGKNFSSRFSLFLKVGERAKIEIGKDVFINDNSSIVCHNNISIGDGTLLGSNVMIYDHNHRYGSEISLLKSGYVSEEINIGKNVWIGLGAIILMGVSIQDNVVIAAGTVVKSDIDNGVLAFNRKELNTHKLK